MTDSTNRPIIRREIQICVFTTNRPGKFAEICDLLVANGVDIRAMMGTEASDHGVMRMVVSDTEKATTALEAQKIPFLQTEALAVEVSNHPGVAATLGRRLAQAGINIDYYYFSGGDPGRRALMVFVVSDIEGALQVLADASEGLYPQ